MTIDIYANFPGGNISVEKIEGDDVYVHQELRDTDRDWFYWCFGIKGAAAGKKLTFHFTKSRALAGLGPAISRDNCETWSWLGSDCVQDNAFTYTFADDESEIYFSYAMPYQLSRWQEFLKHSDFSNALTEHELAVTKRGRQNYYYTIDARKERQRRLHISARHHCCEMMVNYAIEGLLEWLFQSDCTEATYLRDHVDILLVPFVDLDGVEDGDQGKGRSPRDHGRDYLDESIYPSCAAIRQLAGNWGKDEIDMYFDMHCPWIAGKHNEDTYFVGSRFEENATQQIVFSKLVEQHTQGPLPFSHDNHLPFGEAWNVGANSNDGAGINVWAAQLPSTKLCTTIELPYAIASGAEVNQVTAKAFGPDLGRALGFYLRDHIDE